MSFVEVSIWEGETQFFGSLNWWRKNCGARGDGLSYYGSSTTTNEEAIEIIHWADVLLPSVCGRIPSSFVSADSTHYGVAG